MGIFGTDRIFPAGFDSAAAWHQQRCQLLLGINNVVNAFIINLVVTTTAGQQKIISFLIFDKQKANQAAEQINAMIAGRLDDTNTRQQTNRVIDANAQQTDRIIDAINSNK